MDLLHKPFTGPPIDVMHLDIQMQYYTRLDCGLAALKWRDPLGGGPLIQAHLVALLYGHMLSILKETRDELFNRVGALALVNVRNKGATGFDFSPWKKMGEAGVCHTLWPWHIVPPEQITAPRIYSVTLRLGQPTSKCPTGRWIHLDMATGLEHVLAPSSILIAITDFSRNGSNETRYLLSRLLWQMNLFWGSPSMVTLFSEGLAYAAAEKAMRSGPFLSLLKYRT